MEKILSKIKADMTSLIVGITAFAMRQIGKLNTGLSQWMGDEKTLIGLLKDAIGSGHYEVLNDNVMSVNIPSDWLTRLNGKFIMGIDTIKEGELVTEKWKARRPGEALTPMKFVMRKEYPKATGVEVILYTGEALRKEGDAFSPDNSDLAVVSINCTSENFPANAPLSPHTLIRNFASRDPADPIGVGGSFHAWEGMSPTDAYLDYVKKLEESFRFWRNKAHVLIEE